MYSPLIITLLETFARGGGGGSGGGGGGGGGSGGGSGGGGIIFIGAIGYIPMSWIGKKLTTHDKTKVGSAILWPTSTMALVLLTVFAGGYGFIIGAGALLGTGNGLYGWFSQIRKLKGKDKAKLASAALADPAWQEGSILAKTTETFYKFQSDWASSNLDSMKTYTTPRYHYHMSLMLHALALAGRANVMADVRVNSSSVVTFSDNFGSDDDSVAVGFSASANDSLVDKIAGNVIFTDKSSFIEYWNFKRSGKNWLLDSIDQETADLSSIRPALEAFALKNGYCYSPDWGWLLLPQRGQLFGSGKFGTSDINNHIIGVYEGSLAQVYSYQPNPAANSRGSFYIIAQANTQKSYGNIVVRRKSKLGSITGMFSKLHKIETEWTKFNNKYEVLTSSAEGAASFELLDPTFMEKLEALPFEVNIEVVDNVVYLYSKETELQPEHYPVMMEILHTAYDHMKI
jgi:hypothetical protein